MSAHVISLIWNIQKWIPYLLCMNVFHFLSIYLITLFYTFPSPVKLNFIFTQSLGAMRCQRIYFIGWIIIFTCIYYIYNQEQRCVRTFEKRSVCQMSHAFFQPFILKVYLLYMKGRTKGIIIWITHYYRQLQQWSKCVCKAYLLLLHL